jgi:hypothetical protein
MAPFNDQPIINDTNRHTNGVSSRIPKPKPGDEVPDLSSRLKVERSDKAFGSRAVSLVDLPAGTLFARITTATPGTKAYSSVQISENDHIELNSDLLYCNHSCAPSLIFDMSKFEVRVAPDRDLKKGDALTFWYPSSEWEMAQPFDCNCGTDKCKGRISGVKDMDPRVLRGYWLNEHIQRMLAAKNAQQNGVNGHA